MIQVLAQESMRSQEMCWTDVIAEHLIASHKRRITWQFASKQFPFKSFGCFQNYATDIFSFFFQ